MLGTGLPVSKYTTKTPINMWRFNVLQLKEFLTFSVKDISIKLFHLYQNIDNKMNYELMLTYDTPALRQTGSRNLTGKKTASHDMGYLYEGCDQISDLCNH